MYAIIETGGKQYKVEKDMLVKVEKLDAEVGANVELNALMLVDDKGAVKTGANVGKVTAQVTKQDKFAKILVTISRKNKSESVKVIVNPIRNLKLYR